MNSIKTTLPLYSLCDQILHIRQKEIIKTPANPQLPQLSISIVQNIQNWWNLNIQRHWSPQVLVLTDEDPSPEETSHKTKEILGQLDRQLKKITPIQKDGKPLWKDVELVREIRYIVQSILLKLRDQTPEEEKTLLTKIDGVIARNLAAIKKDQDMSAKFFNKNDQRVYTEFKKVQAKFEHELQEANVDLTTKTYKDRVWKKTDSTIPGLLQSQDWGTQELTLSGLSIGIASARGRREYFEDFVKCGSCGPGNRSSFIALFDGHGGKDCAAFLQNRIGQELNQKLQKIEALADAKREVEIVNVLESMFVSLDKEFKTRHSSSKSGSTALLVLIINKKLYVVNVGDSRAILVKPGENVIQLTDDAKPDKKRFKSGIIKRGGRVVTYENEVSRVNGILAVARSIGDAKVGKGITARGKVSCYPLSEIPKGSKLIIASDGVWDVGSSSEVGKDVAEADSTLTSKQLAVKLMQTAYQSGSRDNISVIVTSF